MNNDQQRIFLCVNSDLGRGNTIGTRFERIAHRLKAANQTFSMYVRSSNKMLSFPVAQPWYGALLGRGLNAIKMYLLPSLQYRQLEMTVFDRQVCRWLRTQPSFSVAHIGEYLPKTIAYLQSKGTNVLLDVPIGFDDYLYHRSQKGTYMGSYVRPTVPMVYQAIGLADQIIAPSTFVSSLVRAKFPKKTVTIIPFGVEQNNVLTPKDIEQKQNTITQACFVGQASARKGIDDLIAVWNTLSENIQIPLIVAGRIPKQKQHLFSSATQVQAAGFVQPESIYQDSQVFVFPTYMEGSAKVVYEAMAHGLVVITTPQAGSIIEHGKTGFIVEAGDREEFEKIVTMVLADKVLRKKVAVAAYHAVAPYTWEAYAEQVIEVYRV